ncbi:hypothetical protein MVLG_03593 [Microbotryum lychnidis-dioicae p1A1 Lamole]|uniref:Uncharacterized protein n=1 Tax=Microbotryum lychnidis-dioicae (strain p1A1 Lamole / MvSl-1064) TaxID=683840 RepID=U5H8P0_USTV1|nr:hypothetical protein MVLG_03593 [Microbotryum lychnidis-dioicae p1A1 Lamole]|eukprot:KDE06039.1 hypothetical protein MVLG_03593 [Microbotryum lychnidis-dioicae p1A1 Lamole]
MSFLTPATRRATTAANKSCRTCRAAQIASSTRPTPRIRRAYSTSSSTSPPSDPLSSSGPPPSRFFTLSTLYPFLLLSITTSLAINLRSSRNANATQVAHLNAHISILERTLEHITSTKGGWQGLTEQERIRIERELQSIGLRESGEKDRPESEHTGETSWSEVFFGNKEKRYQARQATDDDTDWEQVFKQADQDEINRVAKDQKRKNASTNASPSSISAVNTLTDHGSTRQSTAPPLGSSNQPTSLETRKPPPAASAIYL